MFFGLYANFHWSRTNVFGKTDLLFEQIFVSKQKCSLCINKIKINYYTHFEKLSPCFSAVIQIFADAEHFFSGKQKYCLRKYLSAIQKCRLCINKIKINYYTNFEKLSPCFSAVIQIFAEAEQFFSGKQKYCLSKYLSAIKKCTLCISYLIFEYTLSTRMWVC